MAGGQTNGGDLGFEAELFKAADKLRGNLEHSKSEAEAVAVRVADVAA